MQPGNIQGPIRPLSKEEEKKDQLVDPEKFKRVLKVEESDETQKRHKRKMNKTEEGEEEEPEEVAPPPPGTEFSSLMSDQEKDMGIFSTQATGGKTGGMGGPRQAPSLFETMQAGYGTEADFSEEGHVSENVAQYQVPPSAETEEESPPTGVQEAPPTVPGTQEAAQTGGPSMEGTLEAPATASPQQTTPSVDTPKKGTKKPVLSEEKTIKEPKESIKPAKESFEPQIPSTPLPTPKTEKKPNLTEKELPEPLVGAKKPPIPQAAVPPEEEKVPKSPLPQPKQTPASTPSTPSAKITEEINVIGAERKEPKEKKEEPVRAKTAPEEEEHYPIQVINNPDSSFFFNPQHKEQITDTTAATENIAVAPLSELSSITPADVTSASPFTKLSPEAFHLFEKMVGLITVHTEAHVNTTTVVLNMPGSRFDKAEVVLQQFATARNTINVELRCAPEALKVLNDNIENLSAAFEASKLNFQINLQRPILLPEYQVLSRKQDKGDEDQQQQKRKQKEDYGQ